MWNNHTGNTKFAKLTAFVRGLERIMTDNEEIMTGKAESYPVVHDGNWEKVDCSCV